MEFAQLGLHPIDCYRVLFPKNMDANEYALQMSPASKALGLVIRKAEPIIKAKKRVSSGELKDRSSASIQPRHTVRPEHKKTVNQEEKSIPDLAARILEPTSQAQPKAPIEIGAQVNEREIKMMFGDRHYRVRGLNKNLTYDQLKVNVMVNQGDLRTC